MPGSAWATRLSLTRRATRAMSMSWFTVSKNFSMSISTTQRYPSSTYCRAVTTASWALRPGRKPKAASLKWGSKIGVSVCRSACWMKRSSTVGIPRERFPLPPGFGVSTRLTGRDTYVPEMSCSLMRAFPSCTKALCPRLTSVRPSSCLTTEVALQAAGQISPGIAHWLSSHIPVASTPTPSG